MTLEDVLELIKSITDADHYYCGILDAKKNKSLGVYQGRAIAYQMPISRARGSHTKTIKVLVHWTNDPIETEEAALEVFKALESVRVTELGDYVYDFIKLMYEEPTDVGQDSYGVFERVIEAEIYYQLKGV